MDLDMTSIVWFWGTLRRYLSHTYPSQTDKKGMQGKREVCLFYKSISFCRNVKRKFQ